MSQPLRLLVVTREFPFPPNHGGKADIWRRLVAFKNSGLTVGILCWAENPTTYPKDSEIEEVKKVVDFLEIVPRNNGVIEKLIRLLRIFSGLPSNVATQGLTKKKARLMPLINNFNPSTIWLDGIYSGVTANQLAKHFNVPLFTRSHNIEHKYMRGQALLEKRLLNKLTLKLALVHLESFEMKILSNSLAFYDISMDDLHYWRNRGLNNGYWLPPVIVPTPNVKKSGDEKYDIAFLGNLYAPNNVEGVTWFVERVFPRVLSRIQNVSLVISGSNPVDQIINLCSGNQHISLIKNPIDAAEVYASGKVLINPVLSGSGMNIKSVDMLFYNKPIITTSRGVGGMPDSVKSSFLIADDEVAFADGVCDALLGKQVSKDKVNAYAYEVFGQAAVDNLVIQMKRLIENNR